MAAYDRLDQLASHLRSTPKGDLGTIGVQKPDDIVVVSALRTPITRARKGPLAGALPEDFLAPVLAAVCDRVGLDKKLVEDIQVGNVLPLGGGANAARVAMLAAGFPVETSVSTVNRQCSSGLQAVATIASSIKAGYISIGIGAGVESMSKNYGPNAMAEISSTLQAQDPVIADVLLPMGQTSETVAREYGITRGEQDAFAALSHARAARAWKQGWYDAEVLKVKVPNDDGEMVEADRDDGIREGTTAEKLGKLRAAFSETGTTTAGNASQVSDGAAAVLLMRRSTAQRLRLPVLGKIVSFAVAGVPPRAMGIGPVYAIPKALHQAGITKDQVDIFELNEAFASQAVYCVKKLGLDINKVNPKGGAIAFGHPLGMTGAGKVATLMAELKRTGKRVGVVSMCIGTGMGAAGVFEAE